MTFLKSPIDNNYYMVRDLSDKYTAIIMLSTIKLNIIRLNNYLIDNKDNKYKEYKPYIEQLNNKIQSVTIAESRESSSSTSYSVNKGDELVFCLRSKKEWNKFHNFNTIMYVALHEISHIACPEYGHGPLFKKIFAFMTEVAIELNIYVHVDFNKLPEEYCGIYITESII
jgi:predicted metal-dependent hydrolase